MRSTLFVAVTALLLGLAVGCASKKPDPTPESAPMITVDDLRAAYSKTHPDVRIGVVDKVLADSPYLNAANLSTEGIKADDVVTVIDAKENVVANGVVRVVKPDSIAVQFEIAPGGRTPMEGDFVVKF